MKDLTVGPITGHLLKTMGFMLVTMVFQTLYFLIDLYWVGKLGTSSVAAVGLAGNWSFLVLALTQMIGVGTTTVVSHAVGQRDQARALLLFNQSQVLAMLTGLLFLIAGLAVRLPYVNSMSADAETARQAGEYLLWFVPAMALQFMLVAMGSALRGTGNFKPGMWVGTGSVIINMVLAPFLIFGWGTGHAFGVAGAAIASLIAIVVAIFWLALYFGPSQPFLRIDLKLWKPQPHLWRKILAIGLPAGFEFTMTALYVMLVYAVTRPFGAAAQASFGIGMRVIQAGFMPVVALGFSVAPVAGQNFGAGLGGRVIATFKDAVLMASAAMLALLAVCMIVPHAIMAFFTNDAGTIDYGVEYLRIVAWGFIPSGIIFIASSMFQAMGNTMPSLIASAVRVLLVAIPVMVLSRSSSFQLSWVWYISIASTAVQLTISLLLLRQQFVRRLTLTA